FMSFFRPAWVLWTGNAGPVSYALVGIFTAGWFLDFTWFREQFCNYLCPYARFQSAMTDDNTLIIAYDPARGDPRGGKGAKEEGRCIECNKCVTGCPQGIDIRQGFQLECITCARCIDACTDVMGRFGHESLIQYGSLAALAGKRTRFWRPRTVAYAAVLTTIVAVASALVMVRVPFEASVSRTPGSLDTIEADGWVRNTYLLRIANNRPGMSMSFDVSVDGIQNAEVLTPSLELDEAENRMVAMVVRVPAAAATSRTLPLRVHITSDSGERVLSTTFKTASDGGGP